MTRVLITGGAGFVGSNLARDLTADGVEVRILDDLSAARDRYVEGLGADLRHGSVTDPASVRRAVKGVDAVVHLAAMSGVAREAALHAFQSVYGFTGIALRFSNVYGPNCDHKRSVVAEFLRRAAAGKPLVIYGSGRQTRDFLHVDDVSRAVRIALRSPSSGVFQLGTGVETSIARLANLVQKVAGKRVEIERRPPRPGEAARNYVDPSKARAVLRWEARVALPDGLASTYRWIAERATR